MASAVCVAKGPAAPPRSVGGAAAGKVAGLDPHYRPDGSLTTRGKAFSQLSKSEQQETLNAVLSTGSIPEAAALLERVQKDIGL